MHFILFQTSSLKRKEKRTTSIKQSASIPMSLERDLRTVLEPAKSPTLAGLQLSSESIQPKKKKEEEENNQAL